MAMLKLDPTGSGKITYSNFLLAVVDKRKLYTEKSLTQVFKFFDLENKGNISIEGIKEILER